MLPSGRPRNTWVYLSSDMRGCNTLIWIFLYVSFIILHNFPCIPFRYSCLESRCLCVEGYAVEKSIKAQNVEDDLWYALFRIIASKLYIASWVWLPFLANWYSVSMLFCSRIGANLFSIRPSNNFVIAHVRHIPRYDSGFFRSFPAPL